MNTDRTGWSLWSRNSFCRSGRSGSSFSIGSVGSFFSIGVGRLGVLRVLGRLVGELRLGAVEHVVALRALAPEPPRALDRATASTERSGVKFGAIVPPN